jgi:hypothetical protein
MSMMMLDPALTGGWEPGTPVSDSILRQFLVNFRETVEVLGTSLGGRTLRRDDVVAVDVGRPAFIVNTATLHAPLFPNNAEEVMSVLDDFYGFSSGATTGMALLFSPWPTADLRPHGWTLAGHPPLMFRSAGGDMPASPPGLRIEEVRDEAGLRGFEEATVRGFGLANMEAQEPGTLFGAAMLGDERVRMWVGWEENRPVSAASTFVATGINDVFNVATVPEARRRGFGAAVAWSASLADPSLPSLLIASDQGRFVYEQMGYTTLFRFTLWKRDRAGQRAGS